MKRRSKLLFIASVLFVSICSVPQSAKTPARPKAPELKLRIIPSKETYALHEKVFTKTEFTNLTDKTLCFPEPAQDCEVTALGSVIATGKPAATREVDRFICHADGGGVTGDELLTQIEQHWIKLAPNAAHITKSAEAHLDLSVLGQWQLTATYHPPQCSFNIVECMKHLKSAAQTVGCTVPEMSVSAAPVPINVVPPPDQR